MSLFTRLDNIMLILSVFFIAAGLYLGVGLPSALIFLGIFFGYASFKYNPPGVSDE